jgi:hypothetical protein
MIRLAYFPPQVPVKIGHFSIGPLHRRLKKTEL